MPLPVERSQGSVSSLVARFQNAADRDAEQARRQSLPPRRVSSNAFPRAPESHSPSGATPSPQDTQKPLAANDSVSDGETARSPAKAAVPDDQAGSNKTSAVEKIKQKGRDIVEGVEQSAVGDDREEGSVKDQAAKDPAASVELTTPKKKTLGGLTKSPNDKSDSAKTTPARTPASRTHTVSSPKASPASSSKPGSAPTGNSISKSSATPTKASPRTAPSSAKQPSPSRKDSSAKPVRDTKPSSTVKTTPAARTPRLVPSVTGPARHTSSNGASPAHNESQPLKAQLTGTPSRPTASYSAKTRSPGTVPAQAETRPHASTARSALGSAPGRSRSSMSPGASPSAAPRSTAPSGSRLLQGTAASRAKAAEAKTPMASVKSKTSQPARQAAAGSVTKSPSTKRPSSKSVAANGRAESKVPATVKPPAGARLGLAAAGVGQGGKTGKESNDELSARSKSGEIDGEEIVRRGEEGTSGRLTKGPTEEHGAATTLAKGHERTPKHDAADEARETDETLGPEAVSGDTELQQASAGETAREEQAADGVEASSAPPAVPRQTGEGLSGSVPDPEHSDGRAASQRDIEEIPDV